MKYKIIKKMCPFMKDCRQWLKKWKAKKEG